MKRAFSSLIIVASLILFLKILDLEESRAASPLLSESAIPFTVEEKPLASKIRRIGINLGQWRSDSAEQLMANVLQNPGFEGRIDRVIVIVSEADRQSFSGEAGWGYAQDYWKEAAFDVRTGKSAGKRGTISASLASGKSGLPEYRSASLLPPLEQGDIVVLTKIMRLVPPDHWTFNDPGVFQLDHAARAPESSGTQSLLMKPKRGVPAILTGTLDQIAERGEKMLHVEGRWKLSFWAKGESPGALLAVSFGRNRGPAPFLKESVAVNTEWEQFHIEFTADESAAPPSALELKMTLAAPGNSVWIDDIYLGPVPSGQLSFRKEVVKLLQELHPSYIREFPALGDTWENRIAPPFQRRNWTFRISGGRSAAIYDYSLPEFLALCEEVEANPWIIIPPTFTDFEAGELGKYLKEHASTKRFSEIILEYGSENWNWLYRSAAVPYPKQHGKAASRTFAAIAKEAGAGVNARFYVNGPHHAPSVAAEFLDETPNADGLAITPHFFHTLEKATPDDEAVAALFYDEPQLRDAFSKDTYARDKELALSEINLYTVKGDAGSFERNRIAAGAVSGSALAKQILDYYKAGADPILIYNLLQFETTAWESDDSVRLWGITRRLNPQPLLRPSGLAMVMLNRVIEGDLHDATLLDESFLEGAKITLAAFSTPGQWAAAAVSESTSPQMVRLEFPKDLRTLPNALLVLESDSPFDTNEFEEKVKIVKKRLEIIDRSAQFAIPPRGFVVLLHEN